MVWLPLFLSKYRFSLLNDNFDADCVTEIVSFRLPSLGLMTISVLRSFPVSFAETENVTILLVKFLIGLKII